MRRAWLPIALIVILPAVACFANGTNTAGNDDSKVISELEEKALAHLQKQYPHIEAGRFKLISKIRLPSNTSGETVVPFTYTDKATVKCLAYKDGPSTFRLQFFKDQYTVRIRLDGIIVAVDEARLSDDQFYSAFFPDCDVRPLTLPKTLMGYWN